MKKQLRGSICLLLAAMIWGGGFVAQSEGVSRIGPFTLQATRFFLAGVALLPVIAVCDAKNRTVHRPVTAAEKRRQLRSGILCGCILFVASFLQQTGLIYTTVGKSGFITALYIIFVPLIGMALGKRTPKRIWYYVLMAAVGLYFLCVRGALSINRGDILTLLCAVGFACHILYIDRVSPYTDGIRLSCTQFFTVSAISAVCMLIFEQPSWQSILSCWLPICYAGFISAGLGYTLQILGQSSVPETLASLLMSLESVFAALFGWILLHQGLSEKELFGCFLMFTGIILAQLPEKKKQE